MALENRHPDAERLAEYADGVLGPAERLEVERHLAACADCRMAVAETMVFARADERAAAAPARVVPFRARRPLVVAGGALAAAAVLVIGISLAKPEWAARLLGPRTERPELQELIAAVSKEPTRPVEGRLTGGFTYAPAPPVLRGSSRRAVSPDVTIAAAKLDQSAASRESRALAAAGVGDLAVGNLDQAIDRLHAATEGASASALTLTDLSAAYLARSTQQGSSADLELALRAADRALEADPQRLEARFNRALALGRLGRVADAAAAWQLYLARETDPAWRAEAERLERDVRRP